MAFFPSFESLWNNTLGFDPPTRHPVLWWQTVVPVAIFVVAILSPFAVGMGAAFAVGSHRTWRLALGIGLTAWLGSCLLVPTAGHI